MKKFNKAEEYLKTRQFGTIDHELYNILCIEDRFDIFWNKIKRMFKWHQ